MAYDNKRVRRGHGQDLRGKTITSRTGDFNTDFLSPLERAIVSKQTAGDSKQTAGGGSGSRAVGVNKITDAMKASVESAAGDKDFRNRPEIKGMRERAAAFREGHKRKESPEDMAKRLKRQRGG